MNDSLREHLQPILKMMDDAFAAQQMRLMDRPLRASLEIAEHFILDVSEGTVDNPIGQRWFDALHYEVSEWYHEQYGEAMSANAERSARAFVLFRGTPLSLTLPLTVTRECDEPGLRWVHFPASLRDDEDAFDFLDARVSLDAFGSAEINDLRQGIVRIVTDTRSLNTALMTPDLPKGARPMVSRIIPTLTHGVQSVISGSAERRGAAVWDFNFAAELTIKVYLRQKRVHPAKIHDIHILHKAAVDAGLQPVESALLESFPDGKRLARHRYGEERLPSLVYLDELYRASLCLAKDIAGQLKRKIRMYDAAFKIRTIGSLARGLTNR